METNNLVLVELFCSNYDVDLSFINSLNDNGLIEVIILENKRYISNEQLKDVEKAIRFYYELNINIEGIDVIFNLLKQIDELQQELTITNNKLNVYLSR